MTLRTATLLAAAMTLLAGCGKPAKKVVTVTGTVTYNGHQLKAGIVKFQAPNPSQRLSSHLGRSGLVFARRFAPDKPV